MSGETDGWIEILPDLLILRLLPSQIRPLKGWIHKQNENIMLKNLTVQLLIVTPWNVQPVWHLQCRLDATNVFESHVPQFHTPNIARRLMRNYTIHWRWRKKLPDTALFTVILRTVNLEHESSWVDMGEDCFRDILLIPDPNTIFTYEEKKTEVSSMERNTTVSNLHWRPDLSRR